MRRYHHIGIPTTEAKPGETHLKHLKLFVVSHEKNEFGVEWMRFEADAAVPDLVRQVPHVAFEVADLASELGWPRNPDCSQQPIRRRPRRVHSRKRRAHRTARIHRPQPSWPPPAEQDADINTLHPKHLLERRRALDTFQEWPANELSSIKQAFPNPRLQANLTPRLSASLP